MLEGVGEQSGSVHTCGANQFVFITSPTARANGPQDLALSILDQNSTRLR